MERNARKGPIINEAIVTKIQFKLKAAVWGTDPYKWFRSFDKNKGGTLDYDELRKLMRVALKIPPRELSDKEIKVFCLALDDDGSGDLNISELADFFSRGVDTLSSAPIARSTDEGISWGGVEYDRDKSHRKDIGNLTAAESEPIRKDIFKSTGFVAPSYKDHSSILDSVRIRFFDTFAAPKHTKEERVIKASTPSRPDSCATHSRTGMSPLRRRSEKSLGEKTSVSSHKGKPRASEDAWQFDVRSAVPPVLPVLEEISENERQASRLLMNKAGTLRRIGKQAEIRKPDTKGALDDYLVAKEMLHNVIDPSLLIEEEGSVVSSTMLSENTEPIKTDADILREDLIRHFGIDPGNDLGSNDTLTEVSAHDLRALLQRDVATYELEASSIPSRRKLLQKFAKDHPMLKVSKIEELETGRELSGVDEPHTTGMPITSGDPASDYGDDDDAAYLGDALTLVSRRTEFDSRSLYTTVRAYRHHRDAPRIGSEDALLSYIQQCEKLKISPLPVMDYLEHCPLDARSRATQMAKMKIQAGALSESFTERRGGRNGRRKGGAVVFDAQDDMQSMASSLSNSTVKPANPYGAPIGGRCRLGLKGFGLGDKSVSALAFFLGRCGLDFIELDLSDNGIGDTAGFEVMRVLPIFGKTLKKLHLGNSNFSKRTMAEMRRTFSISEFCEIKFPELHLLALEKCNLNDRSTAALVRALAGGLMPALRSLDISGNDLSQDSSAIAELLLVDKLDGNGCPLTDLDVSWMNLSIEHTVAIGEAIGENARLQTLNISWNNFSLEKTIRTLATSLLTNIQLTSLDLSYNRIDEKGAVMFAYMLFNQVNTCSVKHLCFDGNPLGASGAHLFIKEESKNGRHISCCNCDFHMSSTVTFDPFNPDGAYTLNLDDEYERTVALRLCSITHKFQAVPGLEVWKDAMLNGQKFKPPVKRLVYPIESEDDVGKFCDPEEVLPTRGMLTFKFAMQTPHTALPTSSRDFGKHLKLFEGKDDVQAARSLVELSKGNAYTCEQAVKLLPMAHDSRARVQACSNFIVHTPDRKNADRILASLNVFEQKLCKKNLGLLYYFSSENPTGHYKLKLEDENERRIAIQLVNTNRLERELAQKRDLPDLSVNGDREYFRHMTLDKVVVHYKTNHWLVPTRGTLEFDYVSPKRPPKWAEEMSDEEFDVFFKEYILLELSKTNPEELEKLNGQARDVFAMLDDDQSGALEVEEVQKAFRLLGNKVSIERAEELVSEVNDDGSQVVEIGEFLKLWYIISKEDDRFNMVNRFRYVAPQVFLGAKQLAQMLRCFGDDPYKQLETFSIFYGRIVDEENMHFAHMAMTPFAWQLLQNRFGCLFLFSPFRPDGFYKLNLEVYQEHLLAKFLIKCALEEPDGTKYCLFEERFNEMGFELNQTWINEGPPHRGRYEVTYRSSRKPSLLLRRRVAERELGWEFPSNFGQE